MAESRLDQIIDLVRECGQLVKDADRRNLHVDAKAGHANFVTDYDKKVQDRLKSGLCGRRAYRRRGRRNRHRHRRKRTRLRPQELNPRPKQGGAANRVRDR